MRLPSPPHDLDDRPFSLVGAAGRFWRLWRDEYASPFFWSKKGLYRFDSKSARYGVLYTGRTLEAAVVEVFGDRWVTGNRRMSRSLADRYWATRFFCLGVPVVDTTGSGLSLLGADSMLFASTEYRITRRWARAFMTHRSDPHGILYHSRKNPNLRNYAILEPAKSRLRYSKSRDVRLPQSPDFGEILDRYEIALV
ncbi:MAG: RES family NAD+ phosphorylase [Verrucomicrobia bacterium]|nr:RES family NAD+ phosphorylase [Verrucomicrobiota bacterium]